MVTGFHIGIKENSQDIVQNCTSVTVALTITWNGGSYNATGNASGVLTVDDTDYDFTAKFNTDRVSSGSEVIFSKELEIPHMEDGTKSLTCTASFATGTQVGTVTASATKTLTSIPGGSTIGATDANIEATSLISINRKNAEYTHSVAFAFGSLSGYLADGAGTITQEEVKLTATSLAFPIPETFYAQIPDDPRGTCTLTVKTYSGESQIGVDRSCTFTVTAAEEKCRPEVYGTVEDSNEATIALTGDKNKLVRGVSNALCKITAEAKNSASLEKKSIDGTVVAEDMREIAGAENGKILFSATDSRGYSGTWEVDAEMIAYIKPTLAGTVARTDPTSGNAVLRLKGKCYQGSFGLQENTLRVYCRIDGGEAVELQPEVEENEYSVTANLSGLSYQSAHTITITAEDELLSVEKEFVVGKGIPVFDWSENDFCFHVPVSVMGQPVENVFSQMTDPDAFAFTDTKLRIGQGTVEEEGYISFNIGENVLQFKIGKENSILIRCKYGSNEWSQWRNIG